MTNFQVYKKTISFSLVMFLIDLLNLVILAGCSVAGFFIADKGPSSRALIGLAIGFVIGLVAIILINIFVNNRIKAAQIAMMGKGVNGEELPDRSFKAGLDEVKGRFGTITAFFFITNAIKGIFNQISRAINRVGTAIGGNAGDSITSAINTAIQILVGYLCDCCLGWILFRKDESAAKAGCEGAIIFFKHGKTLIRNIGRIFGMGLLSLVVFGGAFFGLSYLISINFPNFYVLLVKEFEEIAAREGGTVPEFFANPYNLMIVISAGVGLIFFGVIHSVLIRPFILTGVLRNFMEAGKAHMPSEADFKELDSKSPRFAKLHGKI